MFENEIKKAKITIHKSCKNIDDELTKIKVAIHDFEKLGFDTTALEKALDNVDIEVYKFKNISREIIFKN